MDTSSKVFQKLNAPLQFIDRIDDVELWIKREDLIHSEVSGNKWRKLKYHLQHFSSGDYNSISTFGGAYSNHIAATAALGHLLSIPSRAFVRGQELKSNSTLDFCRSKGMEIIPLSRDDYSKKDEPEFLENLISSYPKSYFIPEGGKGIWGIKGCSEILEEVKDPFDFICCSAGTATTATGIILSRAQSKVRVYPALKGAGFLKDDINTFLEMYTQAFLTEGLGKKDVLDQYSLREDYHFGGYGKVNPQLIDFMNNFHDRYGIPLDPIYTAKMMFGIIADIKAGYFEKGTKVLSIHTGGLQGISGINQRLRNSGNILIKYES